MPTFDSFSFFQDLLPGLIVVAPLLALLRWGPPRRALLALFGLYLLFLVAPRLALFHLVFWLVVLGLQQVLARRGDKRGGVALLWLGVLAVLAPMVIWKLVPVGFVVKFNVWSNEALRRSSIWLTLMDLARPIVIPIGLSFATFRAVDLLIKSNLGLVAPLSPGRVLAFGLFPPLQVVGPIAEYGEVEATLDAKVPLDHRRVLEGCLSILSGLAKVFVGAYPLKWSTGILRYWRYNSLPRVWLGLIAYTWFFYLDFAGYSDLAIGAGRLLGADLRPNFNWPFLQRSPTAFWNNWHISLSAFMRRNVFTPLGGMRARRQHIALVATMLLIALWHDINWSTFAFGVYHAVSLLAHRAVLRRRPARTSRLLSVVKPVLVFVWFAVSLPLLTLSLSDMASLWRALLVGGRLR
jgi:D-alanyl-lipoteichoic acid acyltransferase DltB (MBOAT superfamily)